MGTGNRIDEHEESIKSYLEELLALGELEGASQGIAKQVIDNGTESLSDKQKHVFEKFIIEENYPGDCERCGAEILYNERVYASDNGGYCSYCAGKLEKDD